jgi:TonB dependent receptor
VGITKGSVLLQFGGGFAYDPAGEEHEANINGRFDFNSLADYLADHPRRYQQTFITGDVQYKGSLREAGFYFNGKVPLTQQLTLTAGLRWDGQWNPQPSHPNSAIAQTTGIPNDLGQWQPRLGFAWNPLSNTLIRISAGLYDAPTPATIFQRVFTDNGLETVVADSYFDPAILSLVSSPTLITEPLAAPPPGLTTPAALVVGIAPDFRNPRSFQSGASVQQQVSPKVSISASYLRNSTWNLQRRLDTNLGVPTVDPYGDPVFPDARPNPSVGRLLVNQSSAHSSYNGLLLTANFQLPHRSQLAANYTLSSARDDDSNLGPFSIDSALNPYNLTAERGYSSFDVRHGFTVNGVTNLPLGFKINPVLVVRSGLPYTPVIGFDTQNDANDLNDRAIVDGFVVRRNNFRQPSFFNLDIRFVKDITLPGPGHHLDLFMDIFNMTGAENRNFGPESISLYGLPATPVMTAGQALFAPDTNHFGSARQIQFTARLVAF